MSDRTNTINLGAGPCPLPTSVLETAAAGLLNYNQTGMGLTELSHRSSTFQAVNNSAQASLRKLLNIPDEFEVLFMQGGGLTQFAVVLYNLVGAHRIKYKTGKDEVVGADYVVTGSWSAKAAAEAKRMGVEVNIVLDSRKTSADGKTFGAIPTSKDAWSFTPDATVSSMSSAAGKEEIPAPSTEPSTTTPTPRTPPAFVYYCDNETVNGIEFASPGFPLDALPESHKDVPLVADMSSNILSRHIPDALWKRAGIIYAGAQKNMGPSGVTVVLVRKDLIVDLDLAQREFGGDRVPSMLWYKNIADNESMYNTPPMFSIYVCELVYKHLLEHGGVEEAERVNVEKAKKVYGVIDASGRFYQGKVEKGARSRMNIVFTLKGGKELEERFVKEADKAGIKQVKGHRSVGGIRTSLYNAVTLAQVETVCNFMEEFAKQNS